MLTARQKEMVAVFEKHVRAEVEGDLDATMVTMTDAPHLHNVPTMIGGVGHDGVKSFYHDRLVGKFFPPDMTMERVSLTVGDDQLVEELVIRFTHTKEIEWMLPHVPPTGKRVVTAFVVIVGVKDGKVSHEHIYWDQASVLAQLGIIDPSGLPIVGAESAERVLNPHLPARAY
ncbi:MAG TPA: ester cyclase [Rhodothermales bacterium]